MISTRNRLNTLSYLNLELSTFQKKVIRTDISSHNYYFNIGFDHTLHSDSTHLNSVTDLIIELVKSLEMRDNNFQLLLEKVNKGNSRVDPLLLNLEGNLDYIKQSQNKLNKILSNLDLSFLKQLSNKLLKISKNHHEILERITTIEETLSETKTKLASEFTRITNFLNSL